MRLLIIIGAIAGVACIFATPGQAQMPDQTHAINHATVAPPSADMNCRLRMSIAI